MFEKDKYRPRTLSLLNHCPQQQIKGHGIMKLKVLIKINMRTWEAKVRLLHLKKFTTFHMRYYHGQLLRLKNSTLI